MKNTIILNLFGSDFSPKTACAAYISALLKIQGVVCEYIPQHIDCQKDIFYNIAKHSNKIKQLLGNVDVIVNEFPILEGVLYTDMKYLKLAIVEDFMSYGNNNLNILFTSDNTNDTHKQLLDLFHLKNMEYDTETITYVEMETSQDSCKTIVELVMNILKYVNVEE